MDYHSLKKKIINSKLFLQIKQMKFKNKVLISIGIFLLIIISINSVASYANDDTPPNINMIKNNIVYKLNERVSIEKVKKDTIDSVKDDQSILTINDVTSPGFSNYKLIDTSKAGMYTIYFQVNDKSGNIGNAEVMVNIDDPVADKAAADKVAADKVAADKVAADKVAADKAAADKAAADKAAAEISNTNQQQNDIQIVSGNSFYRNQNANVSFKVSPNTEYSITVYYNSGPSKANGLYSKVSDSQGNISWTWKIGARTASGSYTLTVSGGNQSQDFNFTVN